MTAGRHGSCLNPNIPFAGGARLYVLLLFLWTKNIYGYASAEKWVLFLCPILEVRIMKLPLISKLFQSRASPQNSLFGSTEKHGDGSLASEAAEERDR